MEDVLKIIRELEQTSSTNDKIAIMEKEKDNELFKRVLLYTYDTNMQFGFSEKNLKKLLEHKTVIAKNPWRDVFEMLDTLATSNINNALRQGVKTFLLQQEEDMRELYIRMLIKDLRCNISVKTINKAIERLIEVWQIQQAYSLSKVKLKAGEWIALSLKLNGIRSSFLDDKFKSRQNKIMSGYDHIKEDLKKLGIDYLFVDGEMIRKNIDNVPDEENFRLTTSIVNSDDSDKTQIKFVIFDMITKEDFIRGESKLKYKERLMCLEKIREKIKKLNLQHVEVVKIYYTGTDHSKIQEILAKVDSEGYEGLMLLRDCPYRTKRNNGILKVKTFLNADVRIIGAEEGDGKYKDMLGAFIIDWKGVNKVNVGSGYDDNQRKNFWLHKDEYMGKILQIKYKVETKDKDTGLPSVQFPIFQCIRFDKIKPSYD